MFMQKITYKQFLSLPGMESFVNENKMIHKREPAKLSQIPGRYEFGVIISNNLLLPIEFRKAHLH